MITGSIHPSMIKVTELSEAFLKKAHAIMRNNGYKLSSGVQSAAIDWTYEKAGHPTISMHGWHGRAPKVWGAGKTIWAINKTDWANATSENEYEILSCSEIELTSTRQHMLPEEKIKQYEAKLIEAEEYLKSIV